MTTDADDAADPERDSRPSHPIEPGASFGQRFRIEREIAGGGMGTVYHAIDLRNDRPVALKVLKKGRLPDEEARQRFFREAEIMVSMDHPGIVRIRGFGQATDGTPWLAMELLDGETLLDKVRREGPQDIGELVPILSAACDALEAAHGQGVVHRDLKPENIFLPRAGQSRVKLLDFGLSLIAGSAKLTRTGTIIGTPRYMAPEQIRSARSADAKVDVYSLGVIVYEALAGASPFTASDHGQLLGAILTGRTRPLSELRPDLPPAVEGVIGRALQPEPADRYETAGELAEAFAAAAGRASGRKLPRMTSDQALGGLSADLPPTSSSWSRPLDPSTFAGAADEPAEAPPSPPPASPPRFSVPPAEGPAADPGLRSGVPRTVVLCVGGLVGLAGLVWAAVLLLGP
ncbi:MAG: serine/threonine-protein kinase [Myxococcota bacterium]